MKHISTHTLKLFIISFMLLSGYSGKGQFGTTPYPWPTPKGGGIDSNYTGGDTLGFNALANPLGGNPNSNDQYWLLTDMNGDGKPDLVVTGRVIGPRGYKDSISFYWLVYINNGISFTRQPMIWRTPTGGIILPGQTSYNGYPYSSLTADYSNLAINTESWNLLDINGDGKPDLIVTAVTDAQQQGVQWGINTSPYWKVYLNNGGGFDTVALNWHTPVGGINDIYAGALGFNAVNPYVSNINYGIIDQHSSGDEVWQVEDMNGDGKPDLVVSSSANNHDWASQFGIDSMPYWKVYLNTGNGFDTIPVVWPTPHGGQILYNQGKLGFVAGACGPYAGDSAGGQSWLMVDINGDRKPDLVVMSTMGNLVYAENSAATNPSWKVYLNTGNGFDTTGMLWSTPVGGVTDTSGTLGFTYLYNTQSNPAHIGDEQWLLKDLNGDGLPDLLVFSTYSANVYTQTGLNSNNPSWKLYINTGSGFNTAGQNWNTPLGGQIEHGSILGFNWFGHTAITNSDTVGSQSWELFDINGDGFADLVVFGTYYATQYGIPDIPYWNVFDNAVGHNLNCVVTDTISNAICLGDTFHIGSMGYTQPGHYTDTLNGSLGCDSMVFLTLTVNPLPVVTLSWDSMVILGRFASGWDTAYCFSPPSEILTGGNPIGGHYSGVGVSNNTIYLSTLEMMNNNKDTVTYTYTDTNGCSASASDAVNIDICEAINTLTNNSAISLYPNPATDQLYIKTQNIQPISTTVYDVNGRIIYTMPFKPVIDINELSSGVYFVEVKSIEDVARKRFVKM